MKYRLFLIPFIFIINQAWCQITYPYQEGFIEFKNGKTISCLVQLAVGYDSIVVYKETSASQPLTSPVSIISALKTKYNTYENFPIRNTDVLMRVVEKGKATLLMHSISVISNEVTMTTGNKEVALEGATYAQLANLYVIKLNGLEHLILEEDFEDLIMILADCESVSKKIEKREYGFNDLEKIVKEYNTCKA